MEPAASEEAEPILRLATRCEKLYAERIEQLEKGRDYNVTLEGGSEFNDTVILSDLSHRFTAWAEFLGVFAQPNICLDRRLRHHASVRTLVLGLLGIMETNLDFVFEPEESRGLTRTNTADQRRSIYINREYSKAISEVIQRLNQISFEIRLAPRTKDLTQASDLTETSESTSFRKMASLVLKGMYGEASENLLELLTSSMAMTYRKFHNRKDWYEKHGTRRLQPQKQTMTTIEEDSIAETEPDQRVESGAQASQEDTRKLSTAMNPPSNPPVRVFQVQSSSDYTSLDSKRFRSNMKKVKQRAMTSIAVDQANYDRPARDKFNCQWCFAPLSDDILTSEKWLKHVNEDHEPYCCISEQCPEEWPRFASSREWLEHMLQAHGHYWYRSVFLSSFWICPLCNSEDTAYPTQYELASHLELMHKGIFTHRQIQAIVQQNEIQPPRPKDQCPLCCLPLEGRQKCSSSEIIKGEKAYTAFSELQDDEIVDRDTKRLEMTIDHDIFGQLNHDSSHGSLADQEQAEIETRTAPPSHKESTAERMNSHIAGHLQAIMARTLRMISTNAAIDPAEGDQHFDSDPEEGTSGSLSYYDLDVDSVNNKTVLEFNDDGPNDTTDQIPLASDEQPEWRVMFPYNPPLGPDDFLIGVMESIKKHAQQSAPPASRNSFAIAIICALPEERETVEALMTRDYKEEGQRYGKVNGDDNSYTVGELGGKPVVLVAPRDMGTTNTRDLARGLRISFPSITYAFVVGITGGAPFVPEGSGWKASDIRRGDIIVSTQVIEYDYGREYDNGFKRRTDVENTLPRAPAEVTNFVNQFVRGRSRAFQRVLQKTNADLQTFSRLETGRNGYHEKPGPHTDEVYDLGYRHKHRDPSKCAQCSQCTEWYHEVCEEALGADCQELGCEPHHRNPLRETKIHFGRYASGNGVMENVYRQDLLLRDEGVIGFEMEGAGAWEVFGTIVVKGVIGYADSHKSKKWRGYPTARAALCAAAMIEEIELPEQPREATNANVLGTVEQPRILPRPPNSQYVGYASVLDRLTSCLLRRDDTASGRRQVICVLSGVGGVGKSEIILQFLDKNDGAVWERFWGVFWVDCGSEASARDDFERIGDKCGWSLAGAQALAGVKDQLASSTRPSLLILDNCDDVRTDYSRYIPNSSKVSVILTTRLSDAKKYASVDPRDAKSRLFVQLKGLDAESAVHLVLGASEIEECGQQITDQARKIAASLDYHPLAINVASSLIRSAVYSLEEYVVALQQRLAKKELLDEVSEQARYQKVSTTFEVSADALEKLASTDPSAKAALALLDILGFMHHQYVSEEMFVRAWKYEETVLSEFGDADGDEDGDITHLSAWHVTRCRSIFSSSPPDERTRLFRRARAHLERLSLVSVDRLEKSTSLHLMVHAWARERVSRPGEAWMAVASILALSTEGYTSWQPFTPQLALHHEANFTIWNDVDASNRDQWELCRVWYAYAWQMYRASSIATLKICFRLLEQTRELCQENLEPSAFTNTKYLLGIAFLADGQISKAIEMFEHVVNVQQKLVVDHPDRLASLCKLARAYLADGRISQAVEIFEHVVNMQEKLVVDHPDRLALQHELARAYLADGRISQAVEIFEHVVNVQEILLAEDHPDRLASQHELARAYLANGQISKAVEMFEHVVKVQEILLVEDHPDRLASQHELAHAYLANGQISKAVKIFEHVVKVRQILAEDHDDRLASQHVLAFAYQADGQIAKAVELLKPMVLIKQRKFRVDHRSRTSSEDLLASLISEVEKTPQQRARIPIENESGHETNRTKRRRLDDGIEEATT